MPKAMPFKFRISILLLLLACEGLLLYSILGRGWYETTATLYWLRALVVAAIPIAIGVVCLYRGGRKLSLRSLMIMVACVAAFITIAILPLLNAQRCRLGTFALLARGAKLETTTYTLRIFGRIGSSQLRNSSANSGSGSLPKWLHPLAGRMLDTPTDAQIREVTIFSDQQMSLLIENASNFSSLETILLFGPNVNAPSVAHLADSISTFSALEAIHFGEVAVPDNCLSKMTGMRLLSFHARNPPPVGASGWKLSNGNLESISKMPSLEVIVFSDYDLTNDDLSLLGLSRSLKLLMLYGADVTDSGARAFESAYPDCELSMQ